MKDKSHTLAAIIGESLLLASFSVALGSVEMSSRFSVINFSKDQRTLQNASNALTSYFIIGVIWAIGASSVLWSQFGIRGLVASIITNAVILTWIFGSYCLAFSKAVENTPGLVFPKLFHAIV